MNTKPQTLTLSRAFFKVINAFFWGNRFCFVYLIKKFCSLSRNTGYPFGEHRKRYREVCGIIDVYNNYGSPPPPAVPEPRKINEYAKIKLCRIYAMGRRHNALASTHMDDGSGSGWRREGGGGKGGK